MACPQVVIIREADDPVTTAVTDFHKIR